MQRRWLITLVVAGLVVPGLAACGDDEATGPQFGDLVFAPSFENIGSGREVEVTLSNSSSGDLGPILIGLDFLKETANPDSLCNTIIVSASPTSIPVLAPGGDANVEIDIDTSDVDLTDCPPAQYDADMFAAVEDRILGAATIRFDWTP